MCSTAVPAKFGLIKAATRRPTLRFLGRVTTNGATMLIKRRDDAHQS
jgi:hypothetical protein